MSLTALDIADAERWARLRSLRLGVRVICRGRAPELERALAAAEHDRREIPRVERLLGGLRALDRPRAGHVGADTDVRR
jgi:hypothetical protein